MRLRPTTVAGLLKRHRIRDDVAEPHDSDAVGAEVREKGSLAEVIRYPSLGHSDTQMRW
jgi:hypothetical protein